MRDDRERPRDILEAIERIEQYSVRGWEAFESDELLQTWMLHHSRIIGEATRALTSDFRQQHDGITWSKIIGMRTLLVHHSFAIDLLLVWSVIERDLPMLRRDLEALLSAADPGEQP